MFRNPLESRMWHEMDHQMGMVHVAMPFYGDRMCVQQNTAEGWLDLTCIYQQISPYAG